MESIYKPNRKEIVGHMQKVVKSIKVGSSTDDKAKASLALSVLSLLSVETDKEAAQQLIKFLKRIQQ